LIELNYKEFGSGEPIIILHGLFGTLDNWQTIAKQLAEDYWVFIIDQRNHGRSPHLDDHSYPLMAEDLKSFLDQLWIPRAHVIGHSMGGKTAMQFAVNYPDMVERLIVIDMGPTKNEGGHETIFEALLEVDVQNLASRTDADQALATRIKDYGVRQFLLKNLTRDKEGGYRWKMNLQVIHNTYSKILDPVILDAPYDGEILFIRGGTSDYIGKAESEAIQQSFPNASIKTIQDAGHWVHADAPNELLKLVRQFLSD